MAVEGCETGCKLILLFQERGIVVLWVFLMTFPPGKCLYEGLCKSTKITHRKPLVATDNYMEFTKVMNVKYSLKSCGSVE